MTVTVCDDATNFYHSLVEPLVSLGRASCLDLTDLTPLANQTVVLNANDDQWFRSGAQLLMAGQFPTADAWTNDWQFPSRRTLRAGERFSVGMRAWPNNRPRNTPDAQTPT